MRAANGAAIARRKRPDRESTRPGLAERFSWARQAGTILELMGDGRAGSQ